jgi:HK97 family phage major capsid protein
MNSLTDEIRALEARRNDIVSRSKNMESIEELKRANADLDKINDDLADLRSQVQAYGGHYDFRGSHQQPSGPFNALGTYSMGQGANTNLGGEKRMAFANDVEEMRASAEYRTAFLNYATGRTLDAEQRAVLKVSDSGPVIPTATFNEIIQNIQKATGLVSAVRILAVPGKMAIPVSDINTPAAWHTEGAAIDDSNLPPSIITLGGYELAKLFSMSVATQNMSIAAFETYLVSELVRCTQIALSNAIVNGVGTTQPKGLLPGITWTAANSTTYPAINGLSTDSIVKALALMPANFRQNASFIMNSTMLYGQVANMKDAMGRPIFLQDLQAGVPLRLLGKGLIVDDYMPDNTIILGDPSYYFLNFSQPMSVLRSDQAGFTTGSIIYRALTVVDGAPVAPAFIKLAAA